MGHIFVKKLLRKFQNCVKEGGISQKNDKFGVKYRIARIKKNNIKYFLGMKAEKNTEKNTEIKGGIRPIHIILPVLIGIAVVVWLFADEFGNFDFSVVPLNRRTAVAAVAVIAMIAAREFGMTWRYRTITDGDLSWWKSLKVCMMCEFTSAVTPSAVGGSSMAMVFMKLEGINFGRATTLMIVTLFLDELFFVVSCPIVLMFTPLESLFASSAMTFSVGLEMVFWGIYSVIALWTALLFVGIIVRPQAIRAILLWVFGLRLLKRWRAKVVEMADNMVAASQEVKQRTLGWWLRAFVATAMLWVPRYLLVCALFWGLVVGADYWLVFARQAVVWIVLMVCPTPGGSGIGEWLFTQYYADMMPSVTVAMLVMFTWRIVSYYIYLIMGITVVPMWLRKSKKNVKTEL